ncbi:transposase [Oceaniovalibus sp. ACAM 378]|nr:transposase [Oceaniovalibus sp. ACAM 378]
MQRIRQEDGAEKSRAWLGNSDEMPTPAGRLDGRSLRELSVRADAFVDYYNIQRYHESLNIVTPADVCFRRDKAILGKRDKIKKQTIQQHRLQHQSQAAVPFYPTTDRVGGFNATSGSSAQFLRAQRLC